MPVTEWDPEETSVEELEKELKTIEGTKSELAPEPESFLEVVEEDENEDDDDEEEEERKPPRRDNRINQLTAQRRAAERAAEAEAEKNALLQKRLEALEANNHNAEVQRFQANYNQTKSELRKAAEEGDTDKQIELTERIADMRASARIMDMQRAQAPAAQSQQAQPQAEEAPRTPPPPQAMTWWNQNRWFNSPGNEIETQAARYIDTQLDSEGYDQNSDEYYKELDRRLQKKFPALNSSNAASGKKPKSPTAPTKGQGNAKDSQRKTSDGRLRFTRQELEVAKSLQLTTPEQLKAYRAELDAQGGK